MIKQSLCGKWSFRESGTENWLPASVPGGVHTDLLALGKIPDPFVRDNERKVMWVAEKDWEYQYTFSIDPQTMANEKVLLVFDGLDTLAEVTLNGILLGKTDNMFRQYSWEVKSLLKPVGNLLHILFRSPVNYVAAKQAVREMRGVTQAIPGGPYLRKAPCQWGWDWGPMLPPIGVWKDIRLEGFSLARFDDVRLQQNHINGKVIVEANVSLVQNQQSSFNVSMQVSDPDGKQWEIVSPVKEGKVVCQIEITDPQLWYPNGYGQQPLYKVDITLSGVSGTLDERSFWLGLRTIELSQVPDEWGESFSFVVNGIPVFAKGSNWIPADSLPTRITEEHLAKLLGAAKETHQNMLRVWGGGFYEDDRFYHLCDRMGIMVWQDMIFSCSIYPLNDPEFLDNLHEEVKQNVRRLRHHASLALWCGNNEMEEGWEFWGWDIPQHADLKDAYEKYFFHTQAEWILAEDSAHSYWPSSPSSNTPFVKTQGQQKGDAHYWDVWHRSKPFTAYRDQYPRFMSEFGFQAFPPMKTIKTYADPEDMNISSYVMGLHQRSFRGNGLIIGQMADLFLMPKDFDAFVYLSMVEQGEGIRYGVEHWRRNKKRVSGTIYWQLNDCWQIASWSSLDYFGRWKALHYETKRYYAPVLLSLVDGSRDIEVWVTSDLPEDWSGQVKWQLMTLDGTVLKRGVLNADCKALDSKAIGSVSFDGTSDEARQTILVTELVEGKSQKVISQSLATFTPTKYLQLKDPQIEVDWQANGETMTCTFRAKSLARFVELDFADADVVFSDNYFDVVAGIPVEITFTLPAGWTTAQAKQGLLVRSIYDSYAHA